MKNAALLLFILTLSTLGCKEKSFIYEVNEVTVTSNSSNRDKTKEKTIEQFIAIVYGNIFQKALSPNELVELSELIQSIGDKQIAYETIIRKFMCDPEAKVPTNGEMRSDIGSFVERTYERFYVRKPSQQEKAYFVNFIESRPNITPENIYFAFAISDEYYYY